MATQRSTIFMEFLQLFRKGTISIPTKPIGFSFKGKLRIGLVVVLGYFTLRFMSWDGFKLFILASLGTLPLNAMGSNGISY